MRHPGLIGRRQVVGGLAAASATRQWPQAALAASTTSHTFRLGVFQISVLSDGHLTIPTRFLARNVIEGDIKGWLGQSADTVRAATNVTLVHTPLDVILIDVGWDPTSCRPRASSRRTWKQPASIARP
jgi:hypothetical protein